MKFLSTKPFLWAELFVLLVAMPVIIYQFQLIRYLLPILWGLAGYCYAVHRFGTGSKWKVNWNRAHITWKTLRPILLRFAACAVFLGLAVWFLAPQSLFTFAIQRPWFWLLVMVAYPVLSVIPQEIIFRAFLFERYKTILRNEQLIIVISALGFGFAHIIFQNWVAPLLCVIGGFMFAQTYSKHKSLALVCLEHALFGDFIFTIGLGSYFYHGSVNMAVQAVN